MFLCCASALKVECNSSRFTWVVCWINLGTLGQSSVKVPIFMLLIERGGILALPPITKFAFSMPALVPNCSTACIRPLLLGHGLLLRTPCRHFQTRAYVISAQSSTINTFSWRQVSTVFAPLSLAAPCSLLHSGLRHGSHKPLAEGWSTCRARRASPAAGGQLALAVQADTLSEEAEHRKPHGTTKRFGPVAICGSSWGP